MDLVFSRAGDVSPLFTAFPALERLMLRAGSMRFGKMVAHEALTELCVITEKTARTALGPLLGLSCPKLEAFELTGVMPSPKQMVELLEVGAPRLRRLALRKGAGANTLLRALLASPALERLESIQLAESDLDDGAVPLLLAHAGKLQHLEKLDLLECRISAAGRAQLDGLAPGLHVTEGARGGLRESDIVARTDARWMVAARAIAEPSAWLELGRQGDRVWGEIEGSGHYYVLASTTTRETSCSCASAKDPCKHALALLLLVANDHPFVDRPLPETLGRQSRERPRYDPAWE
jgi:hypothetical protein